MQAFRHLIFFSSVACMAMIAGCGEKRSEGGGGGGGSKSDVEEAFKKSAGEHGVPVRYMMAVAYLESRMSADRSYAKYENTSGAEESERGTILTDTAFGLSLDDLGLDADKAESFVLEEQISAYGDWLGPQVNGLSLNNKDTEDKYYWIWNLAQLHREGIDGARNVQILFAKELIQTLNDGFIWQDPRNGQVLELTPEKPAIRVEDFPANGQQWLQLYKIEGEIFMADHLPLANAPTGEYENTPRRIEVFHCPLDLSGCLELMSSSKDKEVYLEAHYVIPPTRDIFPKVIQTSKMTSSLLYTNPLGEPKHIEDSVRVMLVGNSGRNVGGSRRPALPTWFTNDQLMTMGNVVLSVCQELVKDYPDTVTLEECTSTNAQKGVTFQRQGSSEEHRWGDIPDFDATIFEAYVENPMGLKTGVAFEFARGKKTFNAGSNIPLTVLINPQVRRVELDKLERCANGRVVWIPIETEQVMNERKITFTKKIYDSGPNLNGDQFFRVRVSGSDGKLVGWSIDQIHLRKFDSDETFAPEKYCRFD